MTLFPTDPKRIRSRIRSYERALKKEYDLHGAYDDGAGKRYLLGSLYLLLNDIEGALKHYIWFEKSFGDDIGDPLDLLTWTLVLYRAGDLEAAIRKLRQAMLSNLYLIPHVLQIEQPELDISHLSNLETREYLGYIPDELMQLWDGEALDWLRASYHQAEIQAVRERYIAIKRQLKHEPVGETRSRLVREAFALRSGE
jgi:tetratricopeptide (TPR) repeat protein